MKNLKNKIWATVMTLIGGFMAKVSGDATFLILILMIAIPMFFAKKSWIEF